MNISIDELYSLKLRSLWKSFASSDFSFWMACFYLFFEYVRPQSIWTFLDFYPYWARTFLLLSTIGWISSSARLFVWRWTTSWIVVFLCLVIISSYFAYWPDVSWKHFNDFFNWVLVFFILTNTTTNRHRFYILLLIFLIASFKLSQFGAISWITSGFAFRKWGIQGPKGFFENSGELAIQMLMFAPISLYFLLGIKKYLVRWQIYLLSTLPITAVLTILGTSTRGGQLALSAQIISIVLMSKHRIRAFIAIMIIAYASYLALPEEQKERFESAGDDNTSIQRLLYWQHGWEMMKNHPFLGVGYFNFSPYYMLHHADDLVVGVEKAELPHNIFIQVGTDLGFTGLGVFIFMIIGCFVGTRRMGKKASIDGDIFVANLSKGMNLALLGYLVAGQFVTVTYYPFFWVHLSFVTILYTITRNESTTEKIRH